MIEVKGLSVGYGDRILIERLDMLLPKGSITALIGSNGSGKSSLMRVLNGLQESLGGEVSWSGINLSEINRRKKARMAASLYSNFDRVEGFTVRDLVALGRSNFTGFFGRLSRRDELEINRAIRLTGMTSMSGSELTRLSDGEFRKAMLAKLLAQEAEILFLDEPMTHLDMATSIDMADVFRELAASGKTIVFSSHQLPLAFKLADNVLLIDGIGGTEFGAPGELMNSKTIQGFLKTDRIRVENGDLFFDL